MPHYGIGAILKPSSGGKRTRRAARALQDKPVDQQWPAWADYLAHRQKPAPLRKLVSGHVRYSPLLWGSDQTDTLDGDTESLVSRLGALKRPKRLRVRPEWARILTRWLATANSREASHAYAVECLAWCHSLPWLAARVPDDAWWELLDHLLVTANQVQLPALHDRPLVHQLIAGELALTLAYVLPELEPCQQLAGPAQSSLSHGIVELLDGGGLPHCRHIPVFRPLLACWTRASLLASRSKGFRLTREARDQFPYIVEHALRLTRADGSQMLCRHDEANPRLSADLIATALTLADAREYTALARSVFPKGKFDAEIDGLPDDVSGHSEWSEFAGLRANWSPTSPSLAVAYADRKLTSELNQSGQTIWSGDCRPEVEIDGRIVSPVSDWEEICWLSDDDVDYLELEIQLEGPWRLQRQICLAREDYFLFVADAVLGTSSAQINYRCHWPLCERVDYVPADESREAHLMGKKRHGLILPLALPEWRADRRFGDLQSASDGFQLRQSGNGTALYAPLFIDLHPRRLRKVATWRQLTVAEDLRIVAPDVAVGYRVQVGKEQWLIYRSLTAPSSRTLVGQHIAVECLIARFDEDGEADPLVEVECAE